MSGFDMIGFLKILKIRPIPHDDEESNFVIPFYQNELLMSIIYNNIVLF